MDKNEFLIYNDLVSKLYGCRTRQDLVPEFLQPLKLLLPYSYASFFFASPSADRGSTELKDLLDPEPLCWPEVFAEAERNYVRHMHEDRTLWLIQSREPSVLRESDIFSREERRSGPLYESCYRRFHVDDILQMTIVYEHHFLGVLTLFRTEVDGCFTNDETFWLRSLGVHLNAVLHRMADGREDREETDFGRLAERFALTAKEQAVLRQVFLFRSAEEITETLQIRPNTLQKHMQNIFRKMDVSSRWELLKYRGG